MTAQLRGFFDRFDTGLDGDGQRGPRVLKFDEKEYLIFEGVSPQPLSRAQLKHITSEYKLTGVDQCVIFLDETGFLDDIAVVGSPEYWRMVKEYPELFV